MTKILQKCTLLLFACLWLSNGVEVMGQVSITAANSAYVENFDGMGATGTTYQPGWTGYRYAGTTAAGTLTMTTTTGTASAGGVYNVGSSTAPASSDRAFGTLASGATIPRIGVGFTNNTGMVVTSVDLAGVMEQWRSGSSATVNEKNTFEYSLNATSLNDAAATWVALPAMDLVEKLTTTTTAAAVDGSQAANKTAISASINSLSLANGAIIYIRWNDTDASGSDGIYALDDFSITLKSADIIAPGLAGSNPFSPADEAGNVATNTSLTVIFNENVQAGTGSILLNNVTDNTSQSLDVTSSSAVTFSGATLTLSGSILSAGKSYAVQIPSGAVTDLAGNAFAGIHDNTTWNFNTAAAATPVINLGATSLSFPFTAVNKMSAVQNYTISGSDLQGSVTLTASGPFKISKDNTTFGPSFTFTQAEAATTQTVYARFEPTAAGAANGSITHTSANASTETVILTGTAYDPYNQNFNDPAFLTNSGWMQFSVTGAQVWVSTNFGRDCLTGCNAATPNKAAQINGFAGTSQVNEDWLISPEMDLASFTNSPVLSFASISAFAGDQLRLKYSTDYSGTGNPNLATWTEVPNVFPASNSNVWTATTGVELPKSAKVFVAFVYTSTTAAASRWTVDDYKVEDLTGFYSIPATTLAFGEIASGSTSTSQTFNFRASGFGDVTLTAPTGYVLSADNGNTFASSVVVAAADAAASAGKTIQVRFAPTTKQLAMNGQITFTGTNFNTTGIALTGSSFLKSETFDVATYNIEFFASNIADGSGEFGPVDDALQVTNVTNVIKNLNVDVIGIQELSEETALDEVLANLPAGYKKVISQVYSYTIKQNSSTTPFPAQKIGFVYNSNTLELVSSRVMFLDLYRQAVAGTTTLIDDDFWSSGRLPFMAVFNATVNGITKRVRVIDVHAKSGSAAADYNRRLFDVQVLHDSLMAYYPNDNIILVGDYNDDVDNSIRAGFPSTYKPFLDNTANFEVLTLPLSQAGAFSFPSSGSFLDHFTISNELKDEYISNSTTVEDARAYIPGYTNNTSDHLPVYARFAFTAKDDQTISGFTALGNQTFGVSPISLAAVASSGLPVTYEVVSGPATVSGKILTITGAGTVVLRALQPGDAAYNAALSQEQTIVVGKAGQTLTFAALQAKTFGDAPFALTAASSSNLPVTFMVVSGPATLAGNMLSLTGAGEVTINATQAGNADYLAATAISQSFTVNKASQTITFATPTNKVIGDAPFNLSATTTSGLPVSYSVVSGPATVSGNTVTLTGAGDVTLRASQQGDGNYLAAASVDRTFTVSKASQTIVFAALSNKTVGDAAFNLTATATSGLPVTFAVVSGPATLAGNTLTLTGAGEVRIKASQTGNGTFAAAADVEQAFCVNPARPFIVIGANGLTLTSSVAAGNQWYRNGVLIAGATSQAFQATQGGNYTVLVNAGTCVSLASDPALVIIAGLLEPKLMAGFKAYPNPATTQIQVSLAGAGAGEVLVSLYDLRGRSAFRGTYPSGSANFEELIDVSSLPRNNYILVITAPKGVVRKNVVLK